MNLKSAICVVLGAALGAGIVGIAAHTKAGSDLFNIAQKKPSL